MARPARKQDSALSRSARKTHEVKNQVVSCTKPRHGAKSRQMVSAAGVFKQARNAPRSKKVHMDNLADSTEVDLSSFYKEGLEEARHAISANCELRFDTIHSSFVEKLSSSRTKDQAFFESINNTASAFNTSLDEEQIETTFIRGGKNITEIVNIGQRLEMFKKSIHKDAIKLENYWREWEEIQNDFIELGVNVFGPEAFGQEITDQKPGGYGRSMELLDLEHKEREAELEEEAEELKGSMLKKMRVSDKELDAIARAEQSRILQAFM